MSGKFKARVWSKEDGEYRRDCRLTELFKSVAGTPAIVYSDEGDKFVIEPYTGLMDKNGKEIAIGDIVSKYNGDIFGEVRQKLSGEYFIAWIGVFGGTSSLYDECHLCEVIGHRQYTNENPELLERES